MIGDLGHRFFDYNTAMCQRCGLTRLQLEQRPGDGWRVCSADERPDEAFAAFQAERAFFDRMSR